MGFLRVSALPLRQLMNRTGALCAAIGLTAMLSVQPVAAQQAQDDLICLPRLSAADGTPGALLMNADELARLQAQSEADLIALTKALSAQQSGPAADSAAAQSLRDEVAALTGQRDALQQATQAQKAAHAAGMKQLQEQLARALERNEVLAAELAAARAEAGSDRTAEQLARAQQRITSLRTELDRLRAVLADERATSADQIAQLQAQLEAERAAKDALAADLTAQLEDTRAQLNQTIDASADRLGRILDLKKKITALEAERGRLADEATTVARHLQQTTEELDAVQAQLKQARAQNGILTGIDQVRRAREQELLTQVAALQAAADQGTVSERRLRLRIGISEQERRQLEAVRDEQTAEIARLSRAGALVMDVLTVTRNDRDALRLQITGLKDAAAREKAGLNGQIADLEQINARLKRGEKLRDERLRELQAKIARGDCGAGTAEDFIAAMLGGDDGAALSLKAIEQRLLLSSDLLFRSGSARLSKRGKRGLLAVAKRLEEVLNATDLPDDWVLRVEGHADAVPIRIARYRNNYELSAGRAITVVQFLLKHTDLERRRLMLAGFGSTRPVAEGMNRDALRQNRRVELRLARR